METAAATMNWIDKEEVENDDESVEYEYDDSGSEASMDQTRARDSVGDSEGLCTSKKEEHPENPESDDEWSHVSNQDDGNVSVDETRKENYHKQPNDVSSVIPATHQYDEESASAASSSWSVISKIKALTTSSLPPANPMIKRATPESNTVVSGLSQDISVALIHPAASSQKSAATSSSWSVVPRMNALTVNSIHSESGNSATSLSPSIVPRMNELAVNSTTGKRNHAPDTSSNKCHKKEHNDASPSVASSSLNSTTSERTLADKPIHIAFHSPLNGMVRCRRCTMDNLPGAQLCQACELPITANPTTDLDHEIAVRLARIEEEGGLHDIQSLLLDGSVRPRPVLSDETATDVHIAHSWATKLHQELEKFAKSMQTDKTCNVVTLAPKSEIVRYIFKYKSLLRRESPNFSYGFFLTSSECDSVMKYGVAAQNRKKGPLLVLSHPETYPWQQLKPLDGPIVPKYVWLVLLGGKTSGRGRLRVRPFESEYFAPVYGRLVNTEKNMPVPLLCTANDNFAIPYRSKSTPLADLARSYEQSFFQFCKATEEGWRASKQVNKATHA